MRWALVAALLAFFALASGRAETGTADPLTRVAFPASSTQSGVITEILYQSCPLGRVQCFNHWWRQCRIRGTMTMWVTSPRRC